MDRHLEYKSPQFAVDAEFNSFSDMKHACTHAALLDLYEFNPEQVSHKHYRLKCKDKQCSWLFFASTIPGTDVWQVQTSIQSHTCRGINGLGHSNLDEEFISIEILPKVRLDLSFTSKAIRNHFKDQYGVEISYSKVYRGRERAPKSEVISNARPGMSTADRKQKLEIIKRNAWMIGKLKREREKTEVTLTIYTASDNKHIDTSKSASAFCKKFAEIIYIHI